MLALVFHFEDHGRNVRMGRAEDIEQWHDLAKALGCDFLYFIDLVGTAERWIPKDEAMPVRKVTGLSEVAGLHPGANWVIVDPGAQALLSDFDHPPEPAIYVVGPDSSGLIGDIPQHVRHVRIPVAGTMELWAEHAAAIALWGRKI